MDDSRILITGANGQLGKALKLKYPRAQTADVSELDITNSEAVKKYNWNNVDIILNAAAYTNVDGAETMEGRIYAWNINASAMVNLANVAIQKNLVIFHISTDYVFDGTQNPHKENESLSPLSVYGASKAAGDVAVQLAPQHYLVRTSWVIGDGNNFVRTMLELGKKGVSPKVVADQFGRPTFTHELVRVIDHLLQAKSDYGTYNASNGGDQVSWAELTRAIYKEAGFDKLAVSDTTTAEYFAGKTAAQRPANSTFDLSKLEATGFKPRDWREDLADYVKKELGK